MNTKKWNPGTQVERLSRLSGSQSLTSFTENSLVDNGFVRKLPPPEIIPPEAKELLYELPLSGNLQRSSSCFLPKYHPPIIAETPRLEATFKPVGSLIVETPRESSSLSSRLIQPPGKPYCGFKKWQMIKSLKEKEEYKGVYKHVIEFLFYYIFLIGLL